MFFVCFVVEIVLYVLKGGDIITGLNPFVSALKQNELQIEKKKCVKNLYENLHLFFGLKKKNTEPSARLHAQV